MATSGENYWPPTGRTSWPLTRVIVEYDGWYWHRDKAEKDLLKTRVLEKAGWTVIRIRETTAKRPLPELPVTTMECTSTERAEAVALRTIQLINEIHQH
ncbi:DUF559 domain-containing protein [Rhodococcus qingshengii]|uniref:DUF559 domain-containing protein n=1 Tax=Rhodococcus qingshengii TaxID=334542 RepID=UPI001AE36DC3|nr:DUF559 domain-containing protein [Rhodococcus qingshengii]MBP1053826.1 DUF559 domain-containing protein [Rhodococcus qingshengii]